MTHLDEAADLQRRFGGLERLYGVAGAAAIRRAHVAVVGIGGVGSWAAEALARSGVGRITLIDLDHVAESNINRQVHALEGTLGQAKVLAMQERIAQIHPRCRVNPVDAFVEPDNWPMLLPEGVDAVIDACDELKAKTAMAVWAREQRALFIACVFSREAVAPPDPSCAIEGDGSLNCHGYGSVVSVTATFGQVAAGWVLDRIATGRKH
jgi:tRNA A37 threonylcarbamoyladenosine dehydratase